MNWLENADTMMSSGWRSTWISGASGNSSAIKPRCVSFSGILSVKRVGALAQHAHLPHLLQVVVAQIVQAFALVAHPQFGQRLGIAQRACQHARHDRGDLVDQRQFVAGGDLRMRRQRLLHQRGAGARETQNEDRLRHIATHVRRAAADAVVRR